MSFILNIFKAKVPRDAPTIPVMIVIIAVSEGIPPINSAIPIAIGAVTFLGIIVKIISLSRLKKLAK